MVSFKKSKAGIYDVGDEGSNFEDEDDDNLGAPPTGWTAGAGPYYILNERKEHKKVFTGYQVVFPPTNIYQEVGTQESGTVQLYIFLPDNPSTTASTTSVFMYTTGGGTEVIEFFGYVAQSASTGKFAYHAADIVTGLTTNRWYHVSICWERTAGGYDPFGDGALAQNKCRFYIDGTKYGDYNLSNNNDPARITIEIDNSPLNTITTISAIDAIAFSWDVTYSLDDNLTLEDPVSISASNVLRFVITHEIMGIPMAEVILEESEEIGRGVLLQCTDNYSVGGATASNIIFEGMITGRTLSYPYSLQVVNRASELAFLTVADSYTNDSDGIMSDLITAACDYVTAGTLTDGADMGTITYSADKNLYTIFRDLAFFEGWIWYLKNPVQKTSIAIDFNDGTTDTGVSFTQLSNIWDFGAAKAGRYYTKVEVRGDISSTGSASSSATDILNYGTNVFPYRDSALNTNALCNTAAANILDVLDNDPIIVHFKYQDATVGFIQPGQYITLAYSVSGVDVIPSQTFIVTKIVYDAVSGVGELWATSSISYDLKIVNAITEQLPQANSDLIVASNTSMEAFLAIGSGNARYIQCIAELGTLNANIGALYTYFNWNATDTDITFGVPLPTSMGSLALYITEVVVGLNDADANDYIDLVQLYKWTAYDTGASIDSDGTNRTAPGEYTYSFTSGDLSAAKRVLVYIDNVFTTALEFEIAYVLVKYYYA